MSFKTQENGLYQYMIPKFESIFQAIEQAIEQFFF